MLRTVVFDWFTASSKQAVLDVYDERTTVYVECVDYGLLPVDFFYEALEVPGGSCIPLDALEFPALVVVTCSGEYRACKRKGLVA